MKKIVEIIAAYLAVMYCGLMIIAGFCVAFADYEAPIPEVREDPRASVLDIDSLLGEESNRPAEGILEQNTAILELDIIDGVPVRADLNETEAIYEQLWTDEDAIALAKMVWGEARGVGTLRTSGGLDVSGDCQRAAVVWNVLNRFDAGYAGRIVDVVTAPGQYHGYRASYPVDEDILAIVYDVLDRWNREKHGCEDVGRVLPADYLWFASDGKGHNRFRNEYRSNNYWNWELEDVYGE